jgi:hypothetical protein
MDGPATNVVANGLRIERVLCYIMLAMTRRAPSTSTRLKRIHRNQRAPDHAAARARLTILSISATVARQL